MKPPRFSYACPESLDEALELGTAYGDDAKWLAGGQSLMAVLNLRLVEPKVLIDLNRISSLTFVSGDGGELRIGAMTRHRALESSEAAAEAQPLIPRAAREIGHLAIRNRGTIGGSLAHGDPAAEWPLVALATGARLRLESSSGAREVAAADFWVGPTMTAVHPEELLTEIRIPAAPSRAGFGFAELCRRPGDFAIVAVACRVSSDESGRCRDVVLAVGGADGTPVRIAAAEAVLQGSVGEDGAVEEAVAAATRAVEPGGDVHGSAAYRRRMVGVLARRALREALDACRREDA